jgi:hypothetical protein
MKPPPNEDEVAEYRGSEALEVALADRFAFIVEMPDRRSFLKTNRKK